jgi:two-component system, OmpR family, phosphate regulon response regulator PhoB
MSKPRIVIVEDDILLAKMYSTKFIAEGFDVVLASDGEAALLKIKTELPPDFIIMDMMMPKLSGVQVLEQIRNTPELADLPVLILTNLQDQAQIFKAKELGVVEYLIKANYTPSQIAGFVKQYLARKGKVTV